MSFWIQFEFDIWIVYTKMSMIIATTGLMPVLVCGADRMCNNVIAQAIHGIHASGE